MINRIRTLQENDEAIWDAYVKKSCASVYHFAKWRHLIKKVFGHDSHYLYAINEQSEIVGILPLIRLKSFLFGDFLISMPYFNYGGAIAESVEIEQEIISAAEALRQQLGCEYVELRDVKQRQAAMPVRTDKVTMILQLPSHSDELWHAIGAKRRAQVKRPVREGVEFMTGGKELLDDFYRVFSINMRDLGTPVYAKKFFSEMIDQFQDNVTIAIVCLKGEAVAAGFLIGYNGKLEIPWASTLRKVNRIGVNMFLYWNILKFAIESGYEQFDFGRSSRDAGTLKFKKQWGGQQQQLYWHYQLENNHTLPGLNPDNAKFRLAISIWQKLPIFFANLLGPPIVKNIP